MRLAARILLLLLFIPLAVFAQSAPEFAPGTQVVVPFDGQPLVLQVRPAASAAQFASLAPGTLLNITAGSVAADGLMWWRVRSTWGQGWVGVSAPDGLVAADKDYLKQVIEGLSAEIATTPTADAYRARGFAYYDLTMPDEAIADFTAAIDLLPEDPVAYVLRGLAYRDRRDFQAALADYDRAIELAGNTAVYYFIRAQVYRDLGDSSQVLADYEQAITLEPENPTFYNARGVTKRELGDANGAIADTTRAIEIDPLYATAYYYRAKVYQDLLGDNEKAIENFQLSLAADPSARDTHNDLGVAYANQNRLPEAIAEYSVAIDLDPDGAALSYNNRGYSYHLLGEYVRAIDDLMRAIAINPGYAPSYATLGNAHYQLGNLEQALEYDTRAVELGYDNPVALYYNRGLVYYDMGDYQKAIDDFSTSISYNPYFIGAIVWRGNAHNQMYDRNAAIADYDLALSIDPNDFYAYYNRAIVYEILDMREEALSDYKQATVLDPQDADAWLGLARVYDLMGNVRDALNAYEQYIALTPQPDPEVVERARAYENLVNRTPIPQVDLLAPLGTPTPSS